jgi:two-component system, NtrC family, response regulator AtoC
MAPSHLNIFTRSPDLPPLDVIFGQTPMMAVAREKIEKIAATTVPVLLQGESGTGKDIFASLIHARSDRSNFALIKVTCPAIPLTLIESELFGYERGSFTGAHAAKPGRVELAHQGTLFLDEVGSLEMEVQAKLLQVLQDGTFTRIGAEKSRRVDARLICSANADLRQQTEHGKFRLDFLFRINAVTIDLPPLRQRVADLPVLIDYLFDFHSRAYRVKSKPLPSEVISIMQRYSWPGNIRQLENMIRSYVLIGNTDSLIAELIPSVTATPAPEIDLDRPVSLKQITKTATMDLERAIILKVLQANGWSRRKTARWLKISYRSLLYKLQELNFSALPTRRQEAVLDRTADPAPEHGEQPEENETHENAIA